MFKKNLFWFCFFSLFVSCSSGNDVSLTLDGNDIGQVFEKEKENVRYWVFDENQCKAAKDYFLNNGDESLFVEISVSDKVMEETVDVGFVYTSDLGEKNELKSLSSRPVVQFMPKDFKESAVRLGFAFDKEKNELPWGFFIRGVQSELSVTGLGLGRCVIGFDYASPCAMYAFSSNGGKVQKEGRVVSLSGVSSVFCSENSSSSMLPVMNVKFVPGVDSSQLVKIAAGGEKIEINPVSAGLDIPLSALKSPFADVTVIENSESVTGIQIHAADKKLVEDMVGPASAPLNPISVDPGLVLSWPKSNWRCRDFELFTWDRFPHVVFMDISSYAYQDRMFKRLAFFVEKTGYKGTLWPDSEIGDKHGYNAHDYKASSLADFYETARKTEFRLNKEELLLKEILLKNGVLIDDGDGMVSAGKGAVISISQESSASLRRQLLAHEGWHGIYFEDEEFRNAVASIYYTMDPKSLDFLKEYFRLAPGLEYDLDDDYLMKNEFMAYLLQFEMDDVAKKYVYYSSRPYCQEECKELADYIKNTNAQGLVGAAELLEQYVNDRWGLASGRIWMARSVKN